MLFNEVNIYFNQNFKINETDEINLIEELVIKSQYNSLLIQLDIVVKTEISNYLVEPMLKKIIIIFDIE